MITEQQLNLFKSQYSFDPKIQALDLSSVLSNTQQKQVNWEAMPALLSDQYIPVTNAISLEVTPCMLKIGYVIFDAICLALGAVGLRSSVTPSTIGAIVHAAAPAMSKIELTIAKMGMAGASKMDLAVGVFNILKSIFTGGCLGAVFSAFTASLTWWDMILYGVTGIATIIAALATDGLAFAAEVIIVLASFGFLLSDSIKAVEVCALPKPGHFTDGMRIRDQSTGRIYLALDGVLCYVPNPQTYNNLFINWSSVTSVPNVESYPIGVPITNGASLVKGTPDGKVFLLVSAGKRWITSPGVFAKYGFSAAIIRTLTATELNAIQSGTNIN